ncbi:MAG: hypothetical protein KatS3mg131_0659 [Candidatus Tectimicrobiota bacterium]|nr:MAG: hypothetical protein KatS3mg131_0659 [Candidatus Tectomicrobia bacterium]
MASTLFDADFLRKLETLRLLARRAFRSRQPGEQRTPRRGLSLEFSDYRRYDPGDDFRYIDWNVYGRLDRLFVKVFTAEEDLTVHLLVDTSQSMRLGQPPKLDVARRVAAALGYIGLHALDRVGAVAFADELGTPLPPQRGKAQILALLRYFEALSCEGGTDLNRVLSTYARQSGRAGLAVVISDFFDAGGYKRGLEALVMARFDVLAIHLVDPAEIAPRFSGAVRLCDIEGTRQRKLTVNRRLLELYHQKLADYFAQLEAFCAQRHIEYLRTTTAVPFEDLVLRYLRRGFYLH